LLLRVPSWISVPELRADPTWDPIRQHPGFRALLVGDRKVAGVPGAEARETALVTQVTGEGEDGG
jgi:hypothetical protein